MIDSIFKEKAGQSTDFKFDKKVVDVFDDMVVRSVPYYLEIQRMMVELACTFTKPDTNLYDLGCSTGTTMISMSKILDQSVGFVGIDESSQMLESCKANLEANDVKQAFTLKSFDLNHGVEIENASVVVLCLTLQFVRPLYRAKLIQSIYDQMNPGGALILVEKVIGEGNDFNRKFIDYYYDYKRRNDYNDMEIAQKREALENILIPFKLSENIHMLEEAGFKDCETFFKWYNFTGLIAIK
ncbi:carboxy-S-adenosyl-L-methionine synthase CmoA [Prolixibacteraceae bacterium Z1-6]|uniref:Carboxy-S-adenosyl-L-methionine synthase n=1 Tax=Draconibacterium aestuarii TaxID=2998507 RepID=A0A9X3J7D2_9BACT|nr:carboxy-S-adenosyl-L-methionine synthase CmoA [Prolixibacteraceae bacterium Z1-6]